MGLSFSHKTSEFEAKRSLARAIDGQCRLLQAKGLNHNMVFTTSHMAHRGKPYGECKAEFYIQPKPGTNYEYNNSIWIENDPV